MDATHENYRVVSDDRKGLNIFNRSIYKIEENPIITVQSTCVVRFFKRIHMTDHNNGKFDVTFDSDKSLSPAKLGRNCRTMLTEENSASNISGTGVKTFGESPANSNLPNENDVLGNCTNRKLVTVPQGMSVPISSHVPEVPSESAMSKHSKKLEFSELKQEQISSRHALELIEWLKGLRLRRLKWKESIANPRSRKSLSSLKHNDRPQKGLFLNSDEFLYSPEKPYSSNVLKFPFVFSKAPERLRLLIKREREILSKLGAQLLHSLRECDTDLQNGGSEFRRDLHFGEIPEPEVQNVVLGDSVELGSPLVGTTEKFSLEPEDTLIREKTHELESFPKSFIKQEDSSSEYRSDASTEASCEVCFTQHPTENKCSEDTNSGISLEESPLLASVNPTERYGNTIVDPNTSESFQKYTLQSLAKSEDYKNECLSSASTEIRHEISSTQYLAEPTGEHEYCSDSITEMQFEQYHTQSLTEVSESYEDSDVSNALLGFEKNPPKSSTQYGDDCENKCSLYVLQETVPKQYCGQTSEGYESCSDLSSDIQVEHCPPQYHTEDYDVLSKMYVESYPSQLNTKSAEEYEDDCSSDHKEYEDDCSSDHKEYEDDCSSDRSQLYSGQNPPYLTEDSECEYSTEETSLENSKKTPPKFPGHEFPLEESRHKLSLTELAEDYVHDYSYDGSAEMSSADSLSQSPMKHSESSEVLSSDISLTYSPLPTSEDSEYSCDSLELSSYSVYEMCQSDVSSHYVSAVESPDKSLFKGLQGEHDGEFSDETEDTHVSDSKPNTNKTAESVVEGIHNRKWLTDDTEHKTSPKAEGFHNPLLRWTEERKTLGSLPLYDTAKYNTAILPCGGSKYGNSVVSASTKNSFYNPGEKICEFPPFVCVLNVDKIRTHCSSCFERLTIATVCGVCSLVSYCSERCRDEHYRIHRMECRYLLNSEFSLPKYVRAMAHLIWKLMDPESESICDIVGSKSYYFRNLKSYALPLLQKECPQFMNFMKVQFKLLQEFLGYFYKFSEFWMLYAKFRRHMKIITDPEAGELGIGMYLGLAAFKHACRPTANVIFLRNVAQIIACTSLKVEDPSMFTLRFVEAMNPYDQRHDDLAVINGGFCNCIQCKDDLTENLQVSFAKENALTMFQAEKFALARSSAIYKCDELNMYLDAREILGKIGTATKREKYIKGKILAIAADASRKLLRFEEAIDYYNQLVVIQNDILGPYDSTTLDSELKLALLQSEVGNSNAARKYLLKCLMKVNMIYGYEHPYVQTVVDLCHRST